MTVRFAHLLEIANEAEGLVCMHLAAMKTLATKAEASAMAFGAVCFSRRALYDSARTTLLKGYDGLNSDDEAEEMEVLSQPVCIPVVPQVSEPIFVGNFPKTVRNDELQAQFHTKDPVQRFGRGKFGCAKLLIPSDKVHQVLSQDSSLCGRKLRVAKWMAPVAQATAAVSKSRVDRGRNRTSNANSVGNSSVTEARFVADFLAAQARPGGGRQLYSRVLAPDKTAQRRMESMETALKRILERLSKLRE